MQEVKGAEPVHFEILGVNEDFRPCEVVGFDIAPVVVDPRRRQRTFVRREEVEGVLGMLWEVDHPPICQNTEERSNATLDLKIGVRSQYLSQTNSHSDITYNKHPLPTLEICAVKLVESEINDATGCQDNDFATLHQSKAKLLLFPCIPC